MLVSSTESHPLLRCLGKPSTRPEDFGCDFLTWIPSSALGRKLWGCQRKAVTDLLASLYDDRLKVERAQWNRILDHGGIVVLIIEGKMSWGTDGVLLYADNKPLHGRKPFTRRQFRRLLYSIGRQGVVVEFSDSPKDTAELIQDLVQYHEPRTGSRLTGRSRPHGQWGKPTSRDWLVHQLTSYPDIGPTTAEAILDHFGGRLPMSLDCTYEELLQVPGLGKKRADSIWRVFHPLAVVGEERKVAGEKVKKTRKRAGSKVTREKKPSRKVKKK